MNIHIKFPCIITFQILNKWNICVASLISHGCKCLPSIWIIVRPSDYNAKPQLLTSMQTHSSICSRATNNCSFLKCWPTSISTTTGLALSFTSLENIFGCIISNTNQKWKTVLKPHSSSKIHICTSETRAIKFEHAHPDVMYIFQLKNKINASNNGWNE